MNDVQQRVVKLIDSAEPKENLRKWVNGYIPAHYKRLSIPMSDAIEIAKEGAAHAMAYFGTKLYFTQALLIGAVQHGYKNFAVVTPSQYGKSWLCGQIALTRANENHQVHVAGATGNTTEIIMGKVISHIQTADAEIRNKLLESNDKIERLQTAMSKRKLAFKGGGTIESVTLGDTFSNPLQGNASIGRGGDYIVDEASLISDDAYAEMGRREFANEGGEKYLSFEISNPHMAGRFMDKLTQEDVPADTLIVWMDVRTAFEEGRIKTKEQVVESDFFRNTSTCRRYFLCELEDYSESSLFNKPDIDDSSLSDDCTYFLGVDSAYKGKDGIEAVLSAVDPSGKIRTIDHVAIEKGQEWIDGVTSVKIINQLMRIIRTYDVKMVCVDIGFGIWLVEGLSQRADTFAVRGVNFGSGTTKARKDAKHYAAVWGDNKRAEMHLDLKDLIENHSISFTSEVADVLKDQMNAVRGIRRSSGGKTGIIPKVDIKAIIGKSPDELDATLLSIHAVILYLSGEAILLYQNEE